MKNIKTRKVFLNETNATHYGGQRTSTSINHGAGLDTEYSFGNTHSILPKPKRDFIYYNWSDFVNTDFKVYQKDIKEKDPIEFGIYQINIGNEKYIIKPAVLLDKGITTVHLIDINSGEIFSTISKEIPESKDLKEGDFFINPNVDEYDSIIDQLIEQGFMVKKEESNQIVGSEVSDIYTVLGM